ncbi:MAG: Hpt domain-containing protein [Planctomycetota bacterium]
MTDEPPLDLELLAELRAGAAPGESDLVSELIDMFVADAPRLLERAREALAAGDVLAAGRAAHALKGNAASLGAGPLAAACNEVERQARAGEAPRLEPLERALERALEVVRGLR